MRLNSTAATILWKNSMFNAANRWHPATVLNAGDRVYSTAKGMFRKDTPSVRFITQQEYKLED